MEAAKSHGLLLNMPDLLPRLGVAFYSGYDGPGYRVTGTSASRIESTRDTLSGPIETP